MTDDFFGPIIHRYTRGQALADGVLVDVTEMAHEAGLRWPTAVTQAVWMYLIEWPADDGRQDQAGRLWDVVWMAAHAIRTAPPGREPLTRLDFTVSVVPRGSGDFKALPQGLYMVCGPGDEGEPVLTILLPNED